MFDVGKYYLMQNDSLVLIVRDDCTKHPGFPIRARLVSEKYNTNALFYHTTNGLVMTMGGETTPWHMYNLLPGEVGPATELAADKYREELRQAAAHNLAWFTEWSLINVRARNSLGLTYQADNFWTENNYG